ncbi:MAG TPA: hypothetical protein VIN08_01800 [Ohtaekwangia sp.]|uniref:hypothetical protein n=1 Tax=Ohtaekwangia sp. TaxID=2066019 RepID=UPI002F92F755
MQQIIFDSSPAYLLLCLLLAVGIAYFLYRANHPWSKTWNRILLALRAVLLFALFFLLLGPIVRQVSNIFEKPLFVVLYDNSVSVKETTDSTTLRAIENQLRATQQQLEEEGYEVEVNDLNGEKISTPSYTATTTDLNGALRKVASRNEGRKIAGVILASDGIYNAGVTPLYASYNFPVYTVALGDSLEHADISIKNISYNKIAYQGNKFPVRVEIAARNMQNQTVRVSLLQRGKLLDQQTKTINEGQLIVYDFQPLANDQGIQKLDVQVEIKPGESNTRNNAASVFVEVVEGKKKILIVSPAPHPDIKALREVIDKNSNYEFLLHIPQLNEQPVSALQPDKIDLVIFHQVPDLRGATRAIFQQFVKSKTSILLIIGQQTDLRFLSQQGMPVKFDGFPREFDDVTPVVNAAFSNFTLSPDVNTVLADYPPLSVHFGKINIALSATPLLFQRVGSLATQKPLLAVDVQDNRKTGVLLGEGIWRWRLNEFDRTENTVAFDELFGKLIQYLSTTEDKRKFRSYPVQQEFSDTEPVVFESQVYNDIYEPVFGNTIEIDLTDESGQKKSYRYVTGPGNNRYQIGGLKEGVYRYRARTTIQQKNEEVRGEFAVVQRQVELQNLAADIDLLKKLAANTGGKFYSASQIASMQQELRKAEARSVIHTEESYKAVVNLKWVFFALLALISIEWFSRRFWGSY